MSLAAKKTEPRRFPKDSGNPQGQDCAAELHPGGLGIRDPNAYDVDQDRLRGGRPLEKT